SVGGRGRRAPLGGVAERGGRDRRRGSRARPGRRARACSRGRRFRCRRRQARGADRVLARARGGGLLGRFRDGLGTPGLAAIAEIKRRSPSAGDLRPDADPARLAAELERAGAAAVSVLVDERFAGSPADLAAARSASRLPLLAKGFFSTTGQLVEMARAGADAVLLLLRDLDDGQVRELTGHAEGLGMDALVEAHDAEELERAGR